MPDLTQITGGVVLPDGSVPYEGRIHFTPVGWDCPAAGKVQPPATRSFELGPSGGLVDVYLSPSTTSLREMPYRVSVTHFNVATRAMETTDLGLISVPEVAEGDSVSIRSLLSDPGVIPTAPDVLAQVTAKAAEVDADRAAAQTARTAAQAAQAAAEQARDAAVDAAEFRAPSMADFLGRSDVTLIGSRWRIDTGEVLDVVASGAGDYNHPVSGRGLSEARGLYTPYLEQTTKALQLIPQSMRADILSGAMAQDHTAALAAVFADTSLRRCVEFPDGAVFATDAVALPATLAAREVIFGSSKFMLRAPRETGGSFLRLRQAGSVGAYGAWDDIRIEGGVFDLNNRYFGAGPIMHAAFLRRALIRDVTLVHRTVTMTPVTLDTSSDVLTANGHGFSNGDAVILESGAGSRPGGHPGSGTRWYVVNATTNTFKLALTSGGAANNFSSAGSTLFVQPFTAWATAIGGTDMQIENIRILNGTGLYQDGLHLIHGRNIRVIGGHVESGDDALALGFEVDSYIPELSLRDVHVTGMTVKASMATAVKIYTPTGSGRSVVGAEISVVGESGVLRNGAVAFDNYGTDSAVNGDVMPIRDIRVSANLTLGSVGRTQTVQPYIAKFIGCSNCHVDGQFRLLGDDVVSWSDVYSERARDCSLTGEVTQISAPLGRTITSSLAVNAALALPTPPATATTNLLANPWASGGTSSAVPSGWRPSSGNNGLTMTLLYGEPDDEGYRKVGYKVTGTTTAASTAILCPNANGTIPFDADTPNVTFEWGVQTEGSIPTGSTLTMAVLGCASDGNTVLEFTDLGVVPQVGRSMTRIAVSHTMVNAGTAFLRGQLAYVIPSGQTVDLTIWVHRPVLTAI